MTLRSRFTALLILLSLAGAVRAQTTQPTTRPGRTIRLLTVGNSFAGNSTRHLRELAAAAGDELILGSANPGGCSLERHWKAVAAYEANPADPAGLLYRDKDGVKVSLYDLLTRQPWDYVTIQQYSMLSDNPATYFPYASNLREYIKRNAPTATILIHQTWAYRQDNPKFASGGSPKSMHEAVRSAYHAMATQLHLALIPVGDAMFAAMTKAPFKPDPSFDPKTAVYPTVPREQNTVHATWHWIKNGKTGKEELIRDSQHANNRGCYLGSCVFYEVLFNKSVVGNSYVPKDISPEDARMLQQIAHETVLASRAAVTTQPSR